MDDGTTAALQGLARTDTVHLHLTGLILKVLVARGTLTDEEAAALIDDARKLLPSSNPMHVAFDELHHQFQ